ncbi:MAG: 3-deoxy-manno-octulosonate cytidylyltransferase [Proteobacteria bacterium]|nr:3-deoxy-manno-octulosonate cytidylyltransferase [Pseudomonadota bacterium]
MIVIIPARHASSRLPGKPLADIHGQPLIQHVYRCATASSADRVVIATDDQRIVDAAATFGAEAVMTREDHASGTDRIAEVVELLQLPDDEIVINVQGDEPMMPAALIDQVANTLSTHARAGMATAMHALDSAEEMHDPNVVKVVTDKDGYAIYFSRAPIPYRRDELGQAHDGAYRHVGIYGYRAAFIKQYALWPACDLEQIERLEQLRVLWNGERIAVCDACELPGPGVDTADDLQRVIALMK